MSPLPSPSPSLFVSHGSPMLMLTETPARAFLGGLGQDFDKTFGRPAAVLCVSAHWETEAPMLDGAAVPETIHDFGGFPEALYQMQYPAPGAPALAARAAGLLGAAGLAAEVAPARGLDHGAWVPLKLAYPDADIPVLQLSIQHHLGPAHHLAVGRALAPLRDEGVLVLGSGSAVHNLPDVMARRQAGRAETPDWAAAFDDWLDATVAAGDAAALADYRAQAPGAVDSHPRDEHLLPLMTAFGAAGPDAKGTRIHASFELGSLSMAAFRFE